MRIYLDSCIAIYLVEGADHFRQPVVDAVRRNATDTFFVSDLVRLECRVGPIRAEDEAMLLEYDALFSQLDRALLCTEVFDLAAEFRASHGLRTPDAIHLASAVFNGCDEFWTNDLRLARASNQIRFRVLP